MFLPLSKFLDFLDPKIDDQVAITKYAEYKEAYAKQAVESFFDQHKSDDWFKEKYHPGLSKANFDRLKERVHENCDRFISDLKEGKFDELNLDEFEDVSRQDENDEDDAAALKTSSQVPDYLRPALISLPSNTLLIKTLPTDRTRAEIEEVCSKVPGFIRLELGEPNPRKNYYRLGWIILAEGTDKAHAIQLIENQKVGEFKLHVIEPKSFNQSISLAPVLSLSEDRIRVDFAQAKKLVYRFLEKFGLEDPFVMNDEWQATFADVDGQISPIEKVKYALDVFVTILRRVFYCCYYNAKTFSNFESLIKSCGNICLRSSKESTLENEYPETHDDIISKLTLKEYKEEKIKYRDVEEQTELFVKNSIKHEKEQKYRCAICSKLFKGEEFVAKHIRLKHEAEIREVSDSVTFYNAYLDDPLRVMPMLEPVNPSTIPGLLQLKPPRSKKRKSL
jgi:stress-induced morphogen